MALSRQFPAMASSSRAIRSILQSLVVFWLAAVVTATLVTATLVTATLSAATKTDGDSKSAGVDKPDSGAKIPASKGKLGKKADSFGISQVERINDQIRQGWLAHGYTPSGPATDGEYCRRVYLDALGRTPSVDELTKYLNDHGPDKKLRLVDRLLGDEYVEEYAR